MTTPITQILGDPYTLAVTVTGATIDAFVARIAALVAQPAGSAATTPWLTVEQAADYLQTTPEAIRAMLKRGTLPCHRLERRVLFDRAELDDTVRAWRREQP